jgi:hypothetical protein
MHTRPSHALVVLQDLKHAIRNYDCSLQAESFRISWLAIVSLLRAVGHVLDKVDGKTSTALKRAISNKWTSLNDSRPEPRIFWEFIHSERNRFLKEYVHGIQRTATVPTLVPGVSATFDLANARGGTLSPLPPPHSCLSSGPFAGRNEKEIAWEAYEWWVEYLQDVERLASQYVEQKR